MRDIFCFLYCVVFLLILFTSLVTSFGNQTALASTNLTCILFSSSTHSHKKWQSISSISSSLFSKLRNKSEANREDASLTFSPCDSSLSQSNFHQQRSRLKPNMLIPIPVQPPWKPADILIILLSVTAKFVLNLQPFPGSLHKVNHTHQTTQ